jgi:hypothetical protein
MIVSCLIMTATKLASNIVWGCYRQHQLEFKQMELQWSYDTRGLVSSFHCCSQRKEQVTRHDRNNRWPSRQYHQSPNHQHQSHIHRVDETKLQRHLSWQLPFAQTSGKVCYRKIYKLPPMETRQNQICLVLKLAQYCCTKVHQANTKVVSALLQFKRSVYVRKLINLWTQPDLSCFETRSILLHKGTPSKYQGSISTVAIQEISVCSEINKSWKVHHCAAGRFGDVNWGLPCSCM